jgi:hypothetical protein
VKVSFTHQSEAEAAPLYKTVKTKFDAATPETPVSFTADEIDCVRGTMHYITEAMPDGPEPLTFEEKYKKTMVVNYEGNLIYSVTAEQTKQIVVAIKAAYQKGKESGWDTDQTAPSPRLATQMRRPNSADHRSDGEAKNFPWEHSR